MSQKHLDRLSAVDAAFLHQEGDATHMHIGGVASFEGPVPEFADVLDHVRSRLHLVPRYRQKLAVPPAGLGRQRWIDDPTFDVEYHVRHTALPPPGDDASLLRLAGRLFSQRLDRTKPLWELWFVEGLPEGAFAIVSKTHHAIVDGVSGADLMTVLFDLSPEGRGSDPEPSGPWQPRPEPSAAQLTATSLSGSVRTALALPLRAVGAATTPRAAAGRARQVAAALGEVVMTGLTAAPDTPLNVRVGPHRVIRHVPARLDDFKRVKNAFGGTVNDVVLAVAAGGLRTWLHGRGMRTEGLELKACVPVSTRPEGDEAALGNRITQLMAPLPVYVADPLERLRRVREDMAGIKESRQALGAEVIAGAQDFAPPTILAQASRLNFSTRFYNVLVTNVPGPQFPLYVLGRRMRGMFPVAFLAGDRALAIAVMSYDGGIEFGLIADPEAMPDLDVLADGIAGSLAEYVELAG